MGPGFESLRTHHKNNSKGCYFFMQSGTFATMLQPRYAWRTPAHQADVRFLQILCFALYYVSLWAYYESLRTHHKNDSASCYFFASSGLLQPCCNHALRGEPRHTRLTFAFCKSFASLSITEAFGLPTSP